MGAACFLITAVFALMTIGGHFADRDWRLDLLRHTPHLLAIAAVLVAAVATLTRSWLIAAVALTVASVNAYQTCTWFIDPPRPPLASGVSDLRVVGFHAGPESVDPTDSLAWLRSRNPDALALTGAGPRWTEAVSAAFPGHRKISAPGGVDAAAAWVRGDVRVRGIVAERSDGGAARLAFTIDAPAPEPTDPRDQEKYLPRGTTPVRLLVVATPAPADAGSAAARNACLAETAERAREAATDADVVVIGSFHAGPGSVAMVPFAHTPLREAQPGRGQPGTWPAALPAWASIALDRALVTSGVTVLQAAVGPDLGSTHRPVLLDLTVAHRDQPTIPPLPSGLASVGG